MAPWDRGSIIIGRTKRIGAFARVFVRVYDGLRVGYATNVHVLSVA